MAGDTPGIRPQAGRFFVRHGDVSLGTTDSLRDAQIMRDLYTIASGSKQVLLHFREDCYALQIALAEGLDDAARRDLCEELLEAFRLRNGTTRRPMINGRLVQFRDRAAAVTAILEARGGFSANCDAFMARLHNQ